MSTFELFLKLGFQHISDITAYDHILFLVALCALYLIRDWKKIAVLVTAFTIGHSISLALATLEIVQVSSELIEFLIPVTILLTAIFNFFQQPATGGKTFDSRQIRNYAIALFFGIIHGLGFSNYLRAMLDAEESIVVPLLSFNIGLEIGQLLIVGVILAISYVFVDVVKIKRKYWIYALSIFAAIVAISLMIDTGKNLF
jgi:ABC-type antimicrobial peptide transport system permease subunit